MAAKKTSRAKSRKSTTRAKAARKSPVRSARKAPKVKIKESYLPESIDIF